MKRSKVKTFSITSGTFAAAAAICAAGSAQAHSCDHVDELDAIKIAVIAALLLVVALACFGKIVAKGRA